MSVFGVAPSQGRRESITVRCANPSYPPVFSFDESILRSIRVHTAGGVSS